MRLTLDSMTDDLLTERDGSSSIRYVGLRNPSAFLERTVINRNEAYLICPAYQHDGHSCAGAGGPRGERDCRVCWQHTDMSVSYRSH